MFIAIFNYIEHLFGKIRPKKLFFMAIDGVAPRAKMNQQRARRFRTALDAEKAKEKALREGVEMPTEDAFDSNCITPGKANLVVGENLGQRAYRYRDGFYGQAVATTQIFYQQEDVRGH